MQAHHAFAHCQRCSSLRLARAAGEAPPGVALAAVLSCEVNLVVLLLHLGAHPTSQMAQLTRLLEAGLTRLMLLYLGSQKADQAEHHLAELTTLAAEAQVADSWRGQVLSILALTRHVQEWLLHADQQKLVQLSRPQSGWCEID